MNVLGRERARLLTQMVPVIHRSELKASPFSCLPCCACGWVGERVHGMNAKKFVGGAMSQYGRHVLEQFRQADPSTWAEIDALRAAKDQQ